jgi:hypothetical protein
MLAMRHEGSDQREPKGRTTFVPSGARSQPCVNLLVRAVVLHSDEGGSHFTAPFLPPAVAKYASLLDGGGNNSYFEG